ncbi:MAG TPA: hypothetical protein VFX05_08935 [Casimicrobiaceae bacterium]|nr:hypothetical protein [Casimicrobiaceae bacterium]
MIAAVGALMPRLGRGLATIVAALVLAAPAAGQGTALPLKDLMGVYLGRATVRDTETNQTETRDIDVEMTPFDRNGFRIRWINVTLVDGKRNVPGVKRRVSELAFRPAKGRNFYVEAPEVNVFAEREESEPMGGDPVRWAVRDANGLHVYSFSILDDGRYELQSYTRRRVGDGIELRYERVVDGKLLRSIEGRAVKLE